MTEEFRNYMRSDKNPAKKKENREKRRKYMLSDLNPSKRDDVKKKNREWQLLHPNKKFKDTNIEIMIENELIKRNFNYKKQVCLKKIAIVDFLLTEYNIVIQTDGCYYHNCPIHHPEKYIGRRERDLIQDRILMENNYIVYRFWEHDILKSPSDCIDSIKLNEIKK